MKKKRQNRGVFWTERKKAFVRAYTSDEAKFNAAKAARVAGYSHHSSSRIAQRLLREPLVRKAIDKKLAKTMMTPEETRQRLAMMAQGSLRPFIKVTAEGLEQVDLSSEEAQKNFGLLKKIKTTRRIDPKGRVEVRTEIEIHDAKDALDKVARIQGQYTDKDKDGNPLQPLYKVYTGVDPDSV